MKYRYNWWWLALGYSVAVILADLVRSEWGEAYHQSAYAAAFLVFAMHNHQPPPLWWREPKKSP